MLSCLSALGKVALAEPTARYISRHTRFVVKLRHTYIMAVVEIFVGAAVFLGGRLRVGLAIVGLGFLALAYPFGRILIARGGTCGCNGVLGGPLGSMARNHGSLVFTVRTLWLMVGLVGLMVSGDSDPGPCLVAGADYLGWLLLVMLGLGLVYLSRASRLSLARSAVRMEQAS